MKPTITVDSRQFQQVFREYAKWNKRDFADIVNAKMLDVTFRALSETPKADVSQIKNLESQSWWPKYVAKRIAGGGVRFRRGSAKINIQGAGYTRAEARQVSRKIIAARSRSVAFVKSGWLPAIKRLLGIVRQRISSRTSTAGVKQVGVPKGSVRPAAPGDSPSSEAINSALGVEKVGVGPLERAFAGAAADMEVYIARKLEDRARRVAR